MKQSREEKARQKIIALLEGATGKKVDLESVSAEAKALFDEMVTKVAEIPERRMRKTMIGVAQRLGLDWSDLPPPKHPLRARLDGQLFKDRRRVAVVELEAKNPKQIRGALLDLMVYPQSRKVLIIGPSEAVDTVLVQPEMEKQRFPFV